MLRTFVRALSLVAILAGTAAAAADSPKPAASKVDKKVAKKKTVKKKKAARKSTKKSGKAKKAKAAKADVSAERRPVP
jgi:ribosomal protein S20